MPSNPLSDPNWAPQLADTIERVVGQVRDKTTKPIVMIARGLVFGLLSVFVGVFALVRLLVELRDRRSDEGWEVYDLLAEGLSQREAAARLGITPGAVSLRAKAAGLRAEEGAIPALERVLARLDRPEPGRE